MGLFNTVHVKCPECRADCEIQSKAGYTECSDFTLADCPPDILQDIAHEYQECEACGHVFRIHVTTTARVE